MRFVKKGDIVIHLIDNKIFSGISKIKNECIEEMGLEGTKWDGPGYLIELEEYIDLNPKINRTDILNEKNKKELLKIAKTSQVFYTKELKLREGERFNPLPYRFIVYD